MVSTTTYGGMENLIAFECKRSRTQHDHVHIACIHKPELYNCTTIVTSTFDFASTTKASGIAVTAQKLTSDGVILLEVY